jgi:FixJ family two-component response regulator
MKPRLLVVDDDRVVADTLHLVFASEGFDVRSRYSAHDGLVCARDFRPNVLLCDVSMPEVSGLELAGQIDRELPETKVLMITGFPHNVAPVRAQSQRQRQRLGLLMKPVRPEDLLRETRAMLRTA